MGIFDLDVVSNKRGYRYCINCEGEGHDGGRVRHRWWCYAGQIFVVSVVLFFAWIAWMAP